MIQKPVADGNWEKGRHGYTPMAVVLHIAQGTLQGTDDWFDEPRPHAPSSAHYIVGKTGEIHQYVQERDTAYHAGIASNPTWPLFLKDVNTNWRTIGIENEGFSGQGWTELQMQSLTQLVEQVCIAYAIPRGRLFIISHHEIASYKENMDAWCTEVIRRLNGLNMPPQATLLQSIAAQILKIAQAIAQLKKGRNPYPLMA